MSPVSSFCPFHRVQRTTFTCVFLLLTRIRRSLVQSGVSPVSFCCLSLPSPSFAVQSLQGLDLLVFTFFTNAWVGSPDRFRFVIQRLTERA